MPTTLRNFAVTLAAVGLLSYGSISMGQQDAEQTPSDPTSIENLDQPANDAETQAADEIEAARPDTPPEDPSSSADNSAVDADASADVEASSNDSSNATAEVDVDSGDTEDSASDRGDMEANEDADDERKTENSGDNRDDIDANATNDDEQLSPPEVPEQARDRDANARGDVNADWRKVDRDGVVWFYSPSGQWHIRQGNTWHAYHDGMRYRDLNQGQNSYSYDNYHNGDRSVIHHDARAMSTNPRRYSSAYRGEEVYHTANGQQHAQHVRYDRCGRAFVCVNGRAVYVDVTESSHDAQHSEGQQPTMADEQYQDVPPPPKADDRDNGGNERSNVPLPPAPPTGA